MATRMQQRRGTAAQWTSANPVLAAGEIGFEIDTNKFKVGDGINQWEDLSYFISLDDLEGSIDDFIPLTQKGAANGVATLDGDGQIPVSQLGNVIDGANAALDTLKELADALGNDPDLAGTITNQLAQKVSLVEKNSADWTSFNPVIPLGAIGFESDSGLFKVGNGFNTWTQLPYFVNDSSLQDALDAYMVDYVSNTSLATTLDDYVSEAEFADDLATLNSAVIDIANLQDDKANVESPTFTGTVVLPSSTSIGDVSSEELGYLNGVTSAIQTQINNKADAATVSTTYAPINSPTFTGDVVLPNTTTIGNVSAAELGYVANVTSDIQDQLDDKAPINNPTFTGTVSGVTKAHVGLGNVDNTADADKPISTATQAALDAKASLSGANFTGSVEIDQNLVVDGNLTVNGTTFSASSTSIVIEDNMVQIAHQNSGNTVDLGLVVGYNDGAAKHAGIVRDVSDDRWKLFKGVTTEPSTTVNFAQGTLDDLAVDHIIANGVIFTDGEQTKQGVPSITPINQKTASYTTVLTDRDSLIEINSASGTTLTIPADASVNYPVGTSFDVLQTGAGQVTIAGAGGVTVNATPGLKLRTQWSSATLFKRAANTWVVYGDLSA